MQTSIQPKQKPVPLYPEKILFRLKWKKKLRGTGYAGSAGQRMTDIKTATFHP